MGAERYLLEPSLARGKPSTRVPEDSPPFDATVIKGRTVGTFLPTRAIRLRLHFSTDARKLFCLLGQRLAICMRPTRRRNYGKPLPPVTSLKKIKAHPAWRSEGFFALTTIHPSVSSTRICWAPTASKSQWPPTVPKLLSSFCPAKLTPCLPTSKCPA